MAKHLQNVLHVCKMHTIWPFWPTGAIGDVDINSCVAQYDSVRLHIVIQWLSCVILPCNFSKIQFQALIKPIEMCVSLEKNPYFDILSLKMVLV